MDASASPKNSRAPRFWPCVIAVLASGKLVQWRVCGGEAGLELGDRRRMLMVMPPAAGTRRYRPRRTFRGRRNRIEPGVDGSLDGEIVESRLIGRRQGLPVAVVELEMAAAEGPRVGSNSSEPSHLHQFSRRERPLSGQERRFVKDDVFGGRELESQ